MDEEAQAALAQALLPQLSPEQVVAIQQAVRQQFKAQLIALTEERHAPRNGRARAEQLRVSLLRQRA